MSTYTGQYTTNQKFWAPAGATGVSVTPANTAFTNSSWVSVFTASAASVLTDVVVTAAPTFDVAVNLETGVSLNGGSTWSIIDCRLFFIRDLPSSPVSGRMAILRAVDAIPSGALVGVRMRKTGTDVNPWGYKLGYLVKPLAGNVDVTTMPGIAVPDSAALFQVPFTTGAWTYGSTVTLIASAPVAYDVVAYCAPRAFNGQNYEIEILRNGNHFDMFRGWNGLEGDLHYNVLRNPLTGIQIGDAITARWRTNAASNPTNGNFGMVVQQHV